MDLISIPTFQNALKSALSLYPPAFEFVSNVIGICIAISLPLCIIFFFGIVYCVESLKRIRNREEEIYDTKTEPAYEAVPKADQHLTNRWENVQKHMTSTNQNDWKQAIIEADVMLDDILTRMGYRGESVGEKLKRVATGDFASLDDAWEAHKVRNRIAHDGTGFVLTEHDAKHAISRYKKVFEEFYYI
ncbi:MAG: hypothetical protein WCG02_02175 [Candidatus Taylorbacteria bacterium]